MGNKASLIDWETYLLACHSYIEDNPVRAHMVAHAAAYPWSSHLHYAACRVNRLITGYPEYHALGASEQERRSTFRSLFAAPLEPRVLEEIRTAVNTDSAFGSERFMQEAEARLGRSVRPPSVAGREKM